VGDCKRYLKTVKEFVLRPFFIGFDAYFLKFAFVGEVLNALFTLGVFFDNVPLCISQQRANYLTKHNIQT